MPQYQSPRYSVSRRRGILADRSRVAQADRFRFEDTPTYRLSPGRPPRGDMAAPVRTIHVIFPMDLFDRAREICRDPEVGAALTPYGGNTLGEEGANFSDFIRAAALVFSMLLEGPTKTRTLALLNLNDDELTQIMPHLGFHFGSETAIAQASTEAGVPLSTNEAPLDDATPWHPQL